MASALVALHVVWARCPTSHPTKVCVFKSLVLSVPVLKDLGGSEGASSGRFWVIRNVPSEGINTVLRGPWITSLKSKLLKISHCFTPVFCVVMWPFLLHPLLSLWCHSFTMRISPKPNWSYRTVTLRHPFWSCDLFVMVAVNRLLQTYLFFLCQASPSYSPSSTVKYYTPFIAFWGLLKAFSISQAFRGVSCYFSVCNRNC